MASLNSMRLTTAGTILYSVGMTKRHGQSFFSHEEPTDRPYLKGHYHKQLYVWGGRTGVGKSYMMEQWKKQYEAQGFKVYQWSDRDE